jgi:hypothetical protein
MPKVISTLKAIGKDEIKPYILKVGKLYINIKRLIHIYIYMLPRPDQILSYHIYKFLI